MVDEVVEVETAHHFEFGLVDVLRSVEVESPIPLEIGFG